MVIDRKAIDSEPIKTLGSHSVVAKVHPEVDVAIMVEVVSV